MFEEMLGSFLGSQQGQGATQALQQQGLPQAQIQQILAAAVPAAAGSLQQQASAASPAAPALGMFDLLGGHPGQAFLIGAATSMLRGEGVGDAMKDGAASIVGAHVGEVIASRLGVDRVTAARISAAVTPFLVGYVQERLSGHPEVAAKHGPAPETAEGKAKLAAMGGKPGAGTKGAGPQKPATPEGLAKLAGKPVK